MSTLDPAADAAVEASITVADEIEVAGDKTPTSGPDLDLDLNLQFDFDLLEPAGPGNSQQEQRQQSRDDQGQSPDVREDDHHNASVSQPGGDHVQGRGHGNAHANANDDSTEARKSAQPRRVSHVSSAQGSGNDSDHRGDHGTFLLFLFSLFSSFLSLVLYPLTLLRQMALAGLIISHHYLLLLFLTRSTSFPSYYPDRKRSLLQEGCAV